MLFEILLPVGQWVYDKSRVPLSLRRQRPRSLIRAIRNIRVPLTIQAAEPTGLIRAIRVLLTTLKQQSRVRLPSVFSVLSVCVHSRKALLFVFT